MLVAAAVGPGSSGAEVVVCGTCRFTAQARADAAGVRGGARLAERLRRLAAAEPRYAGLAVASMPCLFACQAHCTVHLRAAGKIGYVLGGFAPDAAAARAILDYAACYAASADGEVPYRDWPEGVKGRFLVRVPPPGLLVA